MLKVVDRFNRTREHVALRSMFEARKRFFVDELGWDLPVLAGLYEVDQFDDGHATYLIVVDQDDRHLASARLLHTIRPSPIESACPPFVEGIVPKGRDVWEITRICSLFPEGSDRVWEVHDMLLNGLAKFAVEAGSNLHDHRGPRTLIMVCQCRLEVQATGPGTVSGWAGIYGARDRD